MGQLASELLARALAKKGNDAPRGFSWTSRHLGKPRIDLEDKEAVRALLDEI